MHPSGRADQEPFISLHAISKRFGSLTANKDISLDLRQGEIHAIVGENGAGKSTLMKILNGHLQPDSGEIRLSGRRVVFRHPREAMVAGIGMAYQQSLIFPQLSALENVIVGFEPGAGGWIDRQVPHGLRCGSGPTTYRHMCASSPAGLRHRRHAIRRPPVRPQRVFRAGSGAH